MNQHEMTHDEMEKEVGRPIGTFEKVMFLKHPCTGVLTEWHLILGIWTRMQ